MQDIELFIIIKERFDLDRVVVFLRRGDERLIDLYSKVFFMAEAGSIYPYAGCL